MHGLCLLMAAQVALAGDVTVHSSGRYFQAADGRPVFLVGYYSWASVHPHTAWEWPSKYHEMIALGAQHRLNYIRVSLGISRGNSPQMAAPFKYIDGKADLDQWDDGFWNGLRDHCEAAHKHGQLVHVSIFDGVGIRHRYRSWEGSYWNRRNQARDFFGDLDANGNGNVDDADEFYRTADFENNTGVGKYQRRMLDKTLEVTAPFENVFYEIGNEMMLSPAAWNEAVAGHLRARTKRAITQNGGEVALSPDGHCSHWVGEVAAEVKTWCADRASEGRLFWVDPDGPALKHAHADERRRAAWYSFAGGAAGWGGFSTEMLDGSYDSSPPKTTFFSAEVATGYQHLLNFIASSKVRFWEMTPHHELVSNNQTHSCLANPGVEYVVYVAAGSAVEVDLSALSGVAEARRYNALTGQWTPPDRMTGGTKRSFSRLEGAKDWVVHIVAVNRKHAADSIAPKPCANRGGDCQAMKSTSWTR